MDVEFRNVKLKELAESSSKLNKKYGKIQADKIVQRVNELQAASSLRDIYNLPQTGFHALEGNWKGCFAVYIKHPYRVIFEPTGEFDKTKLETMKYIKILEIYHDYH